jgi:hypothetical protein
MKYVKNSARDVTNPPAAGTNVGACTERPQHLCSDSQIAVAALVPALLQIERAHSVRPQYRGVLG